MKKIYAVWAKVNLTKKPDWLNGYKKKYKNFYPLHVTLKQPCFIDEFELTKIKNIVSEIMNGTNLQNNKIELVFEKVLIDKKDKSIMLLAKNNDEIINLQYKIRIALKDYNNYTEAKLKNYENNFQPHLTITGNVDNKFNVAVKDVGKNTKCVGEINKIILSCVKKDTAEEIENPKNLTVFEL